MNDDMLDSPGTRVGNETNTFVPADVTIRPLRDQIIVEPLEWKPSKLILIAGTKHKPLRGVVRAVGPGTYPKRYNGRKGQRTKSWDSKHFQRTEVKPGDVVELGGLELGGYLFQTFLWGHTEMVICREADVAIIVEQETEAA